MLIGAWVTVGTATEAEATMWLAGDPLPAEREARDDRDPREN